MQNQQKPRVPVVPWVVAGLLALGFIACVVALVGIMAGKAMIQPTAHLSSHRGEDEFPALREIWSYGKGGCKVARIAVEGVIARDAGGGLFGMPMDRIEDILSQIRAAGNDEDVHAIIVEVDSPGGAITPSDEIYRALMNFKESDDERKVVVFVRDLAASGGYYVSMAGDWIVAEPTSVIGSIGVIIQSLNLKGLSEKVGISDTTIKSGANKDLLNPFVDLPPEQRELLQGLIDGMFEHFLGIVQESRGIEADELRKLADGRIFVAAQAKDLNLVDEIGYWDDAIAATKELLGEESVKVIRYERQTHFLDWLSSVESRASLSGWVLDQTRPSFLYLWRP
jgi:protease IV